MAAIDPHLAGSVDDDIGGARHLDERLERTGADEILPKGPHQLEDGVVPEHEALGAQRRSHPRRRRITLVRDEPRADPVQERHAHATRARVVAMVRSAAWQARP